MEKIFFKKKNTFNDLKKKKSFKIVIETQNKKYFFSNDIIMKYFMTLLVRIRIPRCKK